MLGAAWMATQTSANQCTSGRYGYPASDRAILGTCSLLETETVTVRPGYSPFDINDVNHDLLDNPGAHLAPRATTRIDDVDFSVNHNAPQIRGNTAAPCLRHVSRRSFRLENVCEVMQLVAKCETTDRRDRLFGVLGLLSRSEVQPHSLPVDYSLRSVKQMRIRFFAH